MKKTITIIIAIGFLFILFTAPVIIRPAFADERYLRIITENTPFYSDKNMREYLFDLPYTYYVKLLGSDGNTAHIECFIDDNQNFIDGYTDLSLLYDDGLSVAAPYPDLKIKTSGSAVFYADENLSRTICYVFPEREMQYFGSVTQNEQKLYFCSYNGRLGYVKETDVYPFTLAFHPNELTFIPTEANVDDGNEPENNGEKTDSNSLLVLRIVIISCLVLAGLISLFIVKFPKNKRDAAAYYDENEYE